MSAILAIAFVVRLLYFSEIRASPFFEHPVFDARDYLSWAHEIANGKLVWDEPRLYPPAYPYFLAGLVRLTGDNLPAMTFVNALLGCGWIAMLVLALRRLLPHPTAEVAGLAAALYWPFLHFEAHLLSETFFIFSCVLALFLLARGRPGARSPGVMLAAGLALGVATVTRPNAAPSLPFVLWLLGVETAEREARSSGRTEQDGGSDSPEGTTASSDRRRRFRVAPRVMLPFLAGFALVVTPVMVRTHEITGLWALRHHQWINVYLGNRPGAPGHHVIRPGREWDRLSAEPEREAHARTLTDHERYFRDRVLDFASRHPGEFLALQARKLALFFNAREIRVIMSPYFFEQWAPIQTSRWLLDFGQIGPFVLVGLVLAVAARPRPCLLLAFALPQLASVVVTVVGSRYRLPVVPFLIPFAAYALVRVIGWTTARRWGPAGAAVAGVVVAAWFVNRDLPLVSERNFAEEWERVAFVRGEEHDVPGARRAWDRALQEDPGRAETWLGYAAYTLDLGDAAGAEALTRGGLEHAPEDADLLSLRGRAFLLLGVPDSSVASLRASLDMRPDDAETLADYGRSLYDIGRVDEAIDAFRRSLAENPRRVDVLLDTARVLHEVGQVRDDAEARTTAIRLLEEVIRLDPSNADAAARRHEWGDNTQ